MKPTPPIPPIIQMRPTIQMPQSILFHVRHPSTNKIQLAFLANPRCLDVRLALLLLNVYIAFLDITLTNTQHVPFAQLLLIHVYYVLMNIRVFSVSKITI